MHDVINNWLAEKLKVPGVIACGVRSSENQTVANSNEPQISVDAIANACLCLSDTFEALQPNHFPIEFVRWVYKNHFVYGGIRPDGKCLAILTGRKTLREIQQKDLDQIFAEFQQLGN